MKATTVIIALLLSLGLVGAFDLPQPVIGHVGWAGAAVTVTNERTKVVASAVTTPEGEFLVDWSNTPAQGNNARLKPGDVLRVQLAGCTDPSCTGSVTYHGESAVVITLAPTNATPNQGLSGGQKGTVAGLAIAGVLSVVILLHRKRSKAKAVPAKKR